MSEASANQNVRYIRRTDEDDKILENSDNEDRHTIQDEENTSQLECDENQNWYAAEYNLNQPAYDVLTQLSPRDDTYNTTQTDEDNAPIGDSDPSGNSQSGIYSSIHDYQPNEAANCDVTVAQASIDNAIEKYELNQFAHDTEPKSEFSITSLGMLNPTFNALQRREKHAMFELFNSLKLAMANALSACLHAALFEKVIQPNMPWPDIARQIGITAPTIPTTNYIGTSGYWYILDPERRKRNHLLIKSEVTEFPLATGKLLLSVIKEDACAIFDTFQHMYNTRFNTTVDHEGWFTIATHDAVQDLVLAGIPQKTINEKIHKFKNNLKEMIDKIADILIVFVLPKAKENNRLLLREFFAKKSTKYLTVQLPHFNTRLKIHREDVPLHGITAKNNPQGDTTICRLRDD